MLDLIAHLKTLTETHAPSGHEAAIREQVRTAWSGLVDDFEQDGLGSLIGHKRATDPLPTLRRIMLASHMDEIGMLVRDIVDGFIYVRRISGVDNRILPALPVIVHGRQPLPGLVATTPPHLLSEAARKKYPAFDELIVDVGLPADEVTQLVRIGDLVTPEAPLLALNGKRVAGKAMDNRASVAAVTVCLDMLARMRHRWDVAAVATVQEETGLYGAQTAAYRLRPDLAIALDVTFGNQPGVDADISRELGGGPTLSTGPNFHPKLTEALREIARRYEIKFQEETIAGASGTDAWAIQVAREGVPTALIGLPLRNMHSTVETLDLRDIERAGRLMAHFIAELDAEFLATIDWKRPADEGKPA